MMIHLGKAQILKRQIAQPLQRIRHAGAASPHFVQQRFNLRAIHQRLLPFGARLCVSA